MLNKNINKADAPMNRIIVKGDWRDADYIYEITNYHEGWPMDEACFNRYMALIALFSPYDHICSEVRKETGVNLDPRTWEDFEPYIKEYIKRTLANEDLKERLLKRSDFLANNFWDMLPYNSFDGYGPHHIEVEFIVNGEPATVETNATPDEIFEQLCIDWKL